MSRRPPTRGARRASFYERARVGLPLFHDRRLQRAFWETEPVFAELAARAYVERVFRKAARVHPATATEGAA